MNDRDFLHAILNDRKWHSWNEIQRRSQKERGHGLTINSRAADLRRQLRPDGLTVVAETRPSGTRKVSHYRIVPLGTSAAVHSAAQTSALPSPDADVPSGPVVLLPDGDADGTEASLDTTGLLAVPGQLVLEGVAA